MMDINKNNPLTLRPARKPELLAPGGSYVKAVTALRFGADAVYAGGTRFGLRAAAGNLSDDEISSLLAFAHSLGKKVYITLNILPRTDEFAGITEYASKLAKMGVDGVIAADIGLVAELRAVVPGLPVHISTQANTLNLATCRFWASTGASRVNLARELTIDQIREIASGLASDGGNKPELEVFVHGAMCMAYSGRCMLSDYMTGRSSNRGECAQPCRWNYSVSAGITEEKRPGRVFEVEETERGTFLFNSTDLCLLPYLKELIGAGVSALKIEGRMKSDFYVAVTVRAYREAIDLVWDDIVSGGNGVLEPDVLARLLREVSSVSHREYGDGFLHGGNGSQIYGTSSYVRDSVFAGIVESCVPLDGGAAYSLTVSQRGNFGTGELLEFVQPSGPVLSHLLSSMYDASGVPIGRAPHPCMTVRFDVPFPVENGSIVRVPRTDS